MRSETTLSVPDDADRRASATRLEPYRPRLSASFAAHLFKAATKQHHRLLIPTLSRLIPADAVVFDVGAHAGQYTKLLARIAARGRVYAFEPGSYARSILAAVIWLRGLANVTLLPLALGAASSVATMSLPVKQRGSLGFGLAHLGMPESRWQRVAQQIVPVARADDVARLLGLDRLDFIKADVEGWELHLLRGAEEILRRFRPHLLIELSAAHLARAGDRLIDAFGFLEALGYSAFKLLPGDRLTAAERPEDGDFWFIAGDSSAAVKARPAGR